MRTLGWQTVLVIVNLAILCHQAAAQNMTTPDSQTNPDVQSPTTFYSKTTSDSATTSDSKTSQSPFKLCSRTKRVRMYRTKYSRFTGNSVTGTWQDVLQYDHCTASMPECCGGSVGCCESKSSMSMAFIMMILGLCIFVGIIVGVGFYIYKKKSALRAAQRSAFITAQNQPMGYPSGPPPAGFAPVGYTVPPPGYSVPPPGYPMPPPGYPPAPPAPQGFVPSPSIKVI